MSTKWTEEEQVQLVDAINQASSSGINWADVARVVPGRTGKQCREKFKNDLRPDINKSPWSPREEFILAKVHSNVGNQWAEISRYLTGRSENSIKNHWNATLRSKAETKARTFLWFYGKRVLAQSCASGALTFSESQEEYKTFAGPDSMVNAIILDSELAELRVGGCPTLPVTALTTGSSSNARPVRAAIIQGGRSRSSASASVAAGGAAAAPSRRQQQPRATRKQRSWETEYDSEDSAVEDGDAHYSEAGDEESYPESRPSSQPPTTIKSELLVHSNSQEGVNTSRQFSDPAGPHSIAASGPAQVATLHLFLSAAPQHPKVLADVTIGNTSRGKKIKREPGTCVDENVPPMGPPPARKGAQSLSSTPLSNFKSYFAGGGDAAVTVQLGTSKQQGLASKLGSSETERAMWCAASPAFSMMRTPLSMCKSAGRGSDMSDLDAEWDGSVLDMLKDFASSPAGMGSALAQSYYMRASNFSPLSVMKSGREDKENYEAYGQPKPCKLEPLDYDDRSKHIAPAKALGLSYGSLHASSAVANKVLQSTSDEHGPVLRELRNGFENAREEGHPIPGYTYGQPHTAAYPTMLMQGVHPGYRQQVFERREVSTQGTARHGAYTGDSHPFYSQPSGHAYPFPHHLSLQPPPHHPHTLPYPNSEPPFPASSMSHHHTYKQTPGSWPQSDPDAGRHHLAYNTATAGLPEIKTYRSQDPTLNLHHMHSAAVHQMYSPHRHNQQHHHSRMQQQHPYAIPHRLHAQQQQHTASCYTPQDLQLLHHLAGNIPLPQQQHQGRSAPAHTRLSISTNATSTLPPAVSAGGNFQRFDHHPSTISQTLFNNHSAANPNPNPISNLTTAPHKQLQLHLAQVAHPNPWGSLNLNLTTFPNASITQARFGMQAHLAQSNNDNRENEIHISSVRARSFSQQPHQESNHGHAPTTRAAFVGAHSETAAGMSDRVEVVEAAVMPSGPPPSPVTQRAQAPAMFNPFSPGSATPSAFLIPICANTGCSTAQTPDYIRNLLLDPSSCGKLEPLAFQGFTNSPLPSPFSSLLTDCPLRE